MTQFVINPVVSGNVEGVRVIQREGSSSAVQTGIVPSNGGFVVNAESREDLVQFIKDQVIQRSTYFVPMGGKMVAVVRSPPTAGSLFTWSSGEGGIRFGALSTLIKANYAQQFAVAGTRVDGRLAPSFFRFDNDRITPFEVRAAGVLADRSQGSGFGTSNISGVINPFTGAVTPSAGLSDIGTVRGAGGALAALKSVVNVPLTMNESSALQQAQRREQGLPPMAMGTKPSSGLGIGVLALAFLAFK